jgi:hypothetical protein
LAKTLKYRVGEVFLIQRDSGLLMRMVAATDEETESEEVAAMLANVRGFVRESRAGDVEDSQGCR